MSDTQQAPAPKKSRKKLIIIVIVIVVLVALVGSCASGAGSKSDSSSNSGGTASQSAQQEQDSTKIDADKFAKIENGMTYDEVVSIIGSEGSEQSTNEIGDVKTTTYEWESDGWGVATITFQNGKVANKTQFGVNDQSAAKATMDKYNQVKTGMTYDEVVAIMGGDGELSSDTKIAGVSSKLYLWDGEDIASNCSITFSDGKVSSKSQIGLDK